MTYFRTVIIFLGLAFFSIGNASQANAENPKHHVKRIQIVSSLACPGCKRFFENKFEEIKEFCSERDITISFEPFPVDLPTLLATTIAYSMKDRAIEIYHKLIETQDDWHGKNWREKLNNLCLSLDIPQEVIIEVMDRKSPLEDEILMKFKNLLKKHDLKFVPAIIIDDMHVVDADFSHLKKGIEDVENGKIQAPKPEILLDIKGQEAAPDASEEINSTTPAA